MKEHHPSFPTRRMVGGGQSFVPEIFGQTIPAKMPIFNTYLLVAPQP